MPDLWLWLGTWMPHLMLIPILLPMTTGALMLLLKEEQQRSKIMLSTLSLVLGLVVAIALLHWSSQHPTPGVYLAGNWAAPFGISLVLDRLSALMLVLTYAIALAASVFAMARWYKVGVHFYVLFQFQLMGLAGAFLTGDLFNLFVFFEIMLAASYGLLLHGSGRLRVQAGLHYVAINLVASSLFLIGTSMLYGLTGTLNMADLAQQIPLVVEADRALLHSAAAILATAFLIKAAVWPVNFWLVPGYSAATAPVGALFALMTKVGVYTLLRLWTLMFSSSAGASALFGGQWLMVGGMVTMLVGAIGMLAATRLTYLAGYAAITSSGTLLAATGFGEPALLAGLLYYLPSSTLAVAILFLLADAIDRWRTHGTSQIDLDDEEAPFLSHELLVTDHMNLDDEEQALIGRPIPAAAAFLGLAFLLCTLVVAGLPPLSGFLGKLAMLTALLPLTSAVGSPLLLPTASTWIFFALLIGSGLLALIALTRAGIRHFWAAHERAAPEIRLTEGLAIAALTALVLAFTIHAPSALQYTSSTAADLHNPQGYIDAVLQARPIPNPGAAGQEEEAP